MGFWQNLLTRFRPAEEKANPVGTVMVAHVGGKVVWTPTDYKRLADAGYGRNAYVFACVNERHNAVSGIPWTLFSGSGDEEKQVTSHALLDLMTRPNIDQGGGEFWGAVSAYCQISGNAFTTRVGPDTGPPTELWNLRPDPMKVLKGSATEPIDGYQYGGPNGVLFDRDEILHLKSFHPTHDWYGLSPLEAASQSIDSSNLAKAWNVSNLHNRGQPSGAYVFKKMATKEQKDRLRQLSRDQVSGTGIEGWANAGRVLMFDNMDPSGFEFRPFSMNALEMDWLKGQVLSAKEIAIAFNTPPELIGDSASKTYSNYKEARKAFYMENVLPFMDRLRDALNNWLTPLFGEGLRLDYDRDSIEAIQTERSTLVEQAIKLFHSGLVKKGEARKIIGMADDTDDSELVVLPANLIPVFGIEALELDDPNAAADADADAQNEPDPPDPDPEGGDPEGDKQKSWDADTKAAYFKRVDRQRSRFNMSAARTILKAFEAERRFVLQELRGATTGTINTAIDSALAKSRETWSEQFITLYKQVGQPFAEQTFEQLGVTVKSVVHGKAVGDLQSDVWIAEALDYLRNSGLLRLKTTQITETTRKALAKVIALGLEEGDSMDQIAARITSTYADIAGYRAVRIARTEVIAASNLGSMAAARATALPLKKHWLAAIDSSTRDDHIDADGQTVKSEEVFVVGGEELLFPGDASRGASAGNLINCRCALTHSVDRGEETQ